MYCRCIWIDDWIGSHKIQCTFSWPFNGLTVPFYMVLIKFSLKWLKPSAGIGCWLAKLFYIAALPLSRFRSGNIFDSFQSISFIFDTAFAVAPHKRKERHDDRKIERVRQFHFVALIYISVFWTDINDITAFIGWWVCCAARRPCVWACVGRYILTNAFIIIQSWLFECILFRLVVSSPFPGFPLAIDRRICARKSPPSINAYKVCL